MPAQSPAAGSMMMPSRSHDFLTQSSVRPIMIVQVGAIQERVVALGLAACEGALHGRAHGQGLRHA